MREYVQLTGKLFIANRSTWRRFQLELIENNVWKFSEFIPHHALVEKYKLYTTEFKGEVVYTMDVLIQMLLNGCKTEFTKDLTQVKVSLPNEHFTGDSVVASMLIDIAGAGLYSNVTIKALRYDLDKYNSIKYNLNKACEAEVYRLKTLKYSNESAKAVEYNRGLVFCTKMYNDLVEEEMRLFQSYGLTQEEILKAQENTVQAIGAMLQDESTFISAIRWLINDGMGYQPYLEVRTNIFMRILDVTKESSKAFVTKRARQFYKMYEFYKTHNETVAD